MVLKILLWIAGSIIGLFVALLGALYVASTFAPNLGDTLKRSGLSPLPASFVLTRSEAYGMVDQSAFYQGKMSPTDAADLIARLAADTRGRDETANSVSTMSGTLPKAWSAPTWNDRRTFNIFANDVWMIHISPSTGVIEIECDRF